MGASGRNTEIVPSIDLWDPSFLFGTEETLFLKRYICSKSQSVFRVSQEITQGISSSLEVNIRVPTVIEAEGTCPDKNRMVPWVPRDQSPSPDKKFVVPTIIEAEDTSPQVDYRAMRITQYRVS